MSRFGSPHFDTDDEDYHEDLWLKTQNATLREQLQQLRADRATTDAALLQRISTLEMELQGSLVDVNFYLTGLIKLFSDCSGPPRVGELQACQ